MVDQSWSISTSVCQISRYINILVVEILRWFHVTPTGWKAILEVIKGHIFLVGAFKPHETYYTYSPYCQIFHDLPKIWVKLEQSLKPTPRFRQRSPKLPHHHWFHDPSSRANKTVIAICLGFTISCRKKKNNKERHLLQRGCQLETKRCCTSELRKVLIIITHSFVGLGSVFHFRRQNPSRTKNQRWGSTFQSKGW